MKKYSLLFLIILICSTHLYAQKIVTVRGTKGVQDYIKITKVQNTDMWTEVVLEFNSTDVVNATLHEPTGKSPFMLKDRQGNEHILVYQRGWDGPNSGGYGSIEVAAGQNKNVSLFFNKIENIDDVYSLNESNCEGDGCWFFNDIALVNESEGSRGLRPGIKFYKTWIDYNVNENESKGMRIHTNFNTLNLNGIKCRLVVRFRNEKDEYIKSSDDSFAIKSGDLGFTKQLIPGYVNTSYSDISFFIPYSEFELVKGEHMLRIDLDLYPMSGDMIEHINFHKFKFTQN